MIAQRCLKSANARAKRLKSDGRQAKLICKREKALTSFHVPPEILGDVVVQFQPNPAQVSKDPKTYSDDNQDNGQVNPEERNDATSKSQTRKGAKGTKKAAMQRLQRSITQKRKAIE